MTLGLDFGQLPHPGWLEDAGISLNAQNQFARDPPLVLTANGAQFDANNANVYGRIVQLNVTLGAAGAGASTRVKIDSGPLEGVAHDDVVSFKGSPSRPRQSAGCVGFPRTKRPISAQAEVPSALPTRAAYPR
jgi:hypothetical protein